MDILSGIGYGIVTYVALYRFNVPPPLKFSLPPGFMPKVKQIFRGSPQRSRLVHTLFSPPARSNTTFCKFWLYRLVYVMTGFAVYWALLNVPGLTEELQKIINIVIGQITRPEDMPALKDAGPVLLAFIVVTWLPRFPVLGEAEATLRRILYEHAAIPARQLREHNRLKGAVYVVNRTVLEAVRDKLEAENFERSDIVYDEIPTERSLWTKASLLIAHIERWEAQDKYITAFTLLKERDSDILTVNRVKKAYEALKGDARACFRALHDHPDGEETKARKAAFIEECRELLSHIYNLLSRVSLKSHYTERDRVACMNEIGFQLTSHESSPVPVGDDLAALALILSVAFTYPLSHYIGIVRAIGITVTIYAIGLIPILIAYKFPKCVRPSSGHTPAVGFPVVAGLVAWICGFAITLIWRAAGRRGGASKL